MDKTVRDLKIDGVPKDPLLHPGQSVVDDYVCYQLKCKDEIPPVTVGVQDQFGAREFRKFKALELCAPA